MAQILVRGDCCKRVAIVIFSQTVMSEAVALGQETVVKEEETVVTPAGDQEGAKNFQAFYFNFGQASDFSIKRH